MEQARFNMIEQQIRPAEVLDPRVLDVIAQTRRENFVPEAYRQLAFSDINIPLGASPDQVMMKPIMEARLLQALDIQPTDKILEIGTGSGYLTALLAQLGERVFSVELDPALLAQAQARLAAEGIHNVTLSQGDAARGWNQDTPYDVIIVTGSLPVLSESFQWELREGGRMVVIVGQAPVMEARRIIRIGDKEWATEVLFETELPALQNAEQPQAFVF